MKLTDFFKGESINSTGKAQQSQQGAIRSDALNRQVRALVPGQTLQGEVISRNGNEVQIRLADDMVLQAKIDQNMNLEVGKSMTFEVKNNGQMLTLSPLFTNTATDANVLKALNMSSLPINNNTVNMTTQLMEAGLPVDRNTLQQVFREVNQFPQAQTADIVALHKMGLPVNEGNVTQMASYRNLTHQLMLGLDSVLDALPELFSQMAESGNAEGAQKLYQQLVLMVQEAEGAQTGAETGNVPLNANAAATETILSIAGEAGAENTTTTPEMVLQREVEGADVILGMSESAPESAEQTDGVVRVSQDMVEQAAGEENGNAASKSAEVIGNASEATGSVFEATGSASETTAGNIGIQTQSTESGLQTISPENLAATGLLNEKILAAVTNGTAVTPKEMEGLLTPLLQLLKKQWTVSPKDVADAESVEGLYRRLDKQLKGLAQTMESAGQTNTSAYKAVTGLSQNIDFLQQINQTYTYVQLPLRFQQGEAHGELYVYSNKRNLARKDGQISALLHLDMEHLGPVDVYVAMMNEKVSTKFYVQDDDMLDFLAAHMDILTQRLQKRGYSCSMEMNVRAQGEKKEEQEDASVIERILGQGSTVPLAEYSFDVRT